MSEKMRLVCGQCQTINQFPIERLNDVPHCASCKQPLFNGEPISVNASQLIKHIENTGLPVVVDFWAPWCGPCQNFTPIYSQFGKNVGNQLRLLKVDTEAHQQAAIDFNIRSLPTLAIYGGGQEIARTSGALGLPQLQQWVFQELTKEQ
jgi:thioredoxin 2